MDDAPTRSRSADAASVAVGGVRHGAADAADARAEAVLAEAVARTGAYAGSAVLGPLWRELHPSGQMPTAVAEERWRRVYARALAAGRVVAREHGRLVYFAPTACAHLPLPPERGPAPRVYGVALHARCAEVETALYAAAARQPAGRARAVEIRRAWPDVHGGPMPSALVGKIASALEPAVAAGRVRIERADRHVYYRPVHEVHAPAARGGAAGETARADGTTECDGPPAGWPLPSDLQRIEAAARRAAAAAGSGVPIEAIAKRLTTTPELRTTTRAPLSSCLHSLLAHGRLIAVHPSMMPHRGAKRSVYYSYPGGPRQVTLDQLTDFDRRVAVFHACWRSTKGKPFTTAALRRFATTRHGDAFAADSAWNWPNTLQQLKARGEIVGIATTYEQYVRWAPARAWAALSDGERARRLRDAYGRDVVRPDAGTASTPERPAVPVMGTVDPGAPGPAEPATEAVPSHATSRDTAACPQLGAQDATGIADHDDISISETSGIAPDAPPHDPGFLSRNRNMRALVWAAKMHAAAARPAGDGDVVAARPVTADQVAAVASTRTHLLPKGMTLKRALWKATRVRTSMVRGAVIKVDAIGQETYYDVALTPDGGLATYNAGAGPSAAARAYVAFIRATAAAEPDRLERALYHLRDAAAHDAAGITPVGRHVLRARAAQLVAEAQEQAAAIAATRGGTRLLADEGCAADRVAERLTEIARAAEVVGGAAYVATLLDDEEVRRAIVRVPALDAAAAAEQSRDLFRFRLHTARAFRSRFKHSVRTVPAGYAGDSDAPVGAPATPKRGQRGRRVSTALDRVGFASYAMARHCVTGMFGDLAARGGHAMGSLRWPAPFIHTLNDPTLKACHGGAVAALGLLDDAESREAVVRYLVGALRRGALGPDGPAASGALAAAVLALAPKPFGGLATSLPPVERAALEAARAADPYVGGLAGRVLRAWSEGWTRDALLAF